MSKKDIIAFDWYSPNEYLTPYPGANVAATNALRNKKLKKGYMLTGRGFVPVEYIRYKPRGAHYPQFYVYTGGNQLKVVHRHSLKPATRNNKKEVERYNTIVDCFDMTQEHFRSLLKDRLENMTSAK